MKHETKNSAVYYACNKDICSNTILCFSNRERTALYICQRGSFTGSIFWEIVFPAVIAGQIPGVIK